MKSSSPTRRASPLAKAGFHPHFTWRASSGKRASHSYVSYNFLWLWTVLNNALAPKCLALLLELALFVVFLWEIFSPSP